VTRRLARRASFGVSSLLVAALGVTGCERERWIEGGPALPYCLWEKESLSMDQAKRESSRKGMELLATHACGYHKLEFAGEIRCKAGVAQVRCR